MSNVEFQIPNSKITAKILATLTAFGDVEGLCERWCAHECQRPVHGKPHVRARDVIRGLCVFSRQQTTSPLSFGAQLF